MNIVNTIDPAGMNEEKKNSQLLQIRTFIYKEAFRIKLLRYIILILDNSEVYFISLIKSNVIKYVKQLNLQDKMEDIEDFFIDLIEKLNPRDRMKYIEEIVHFLKLKN